MSKRTPLKIRGVFERPKDSGIWWIRYVGSDGKLHREKVGRRSAAVAAYQKRQTEKREGRFFPELIGKGGGLRLAAAISDFLARRDREPGPDYRRYERLWIDELGDRPLSSITAADVERIAAARRRGHLKGSSVNRELTMLRAVFNLAISDGKLNRANPVTRKVFVSEDLFGRERWLSDDEETRLRAELPPAAQRIMDVALQTGFRRGVVFALRWDQIDFENGIARSPAAKKGKTYWVPLSSALRAVLESLRAKATGPWVFAGRTGKPLNKRNWTRRVFTPALERVGIKDFTFHDLRHTFATRLAMSGSSLLEIQHLLGHSSSLMTQRYAHFVEEARRNAITRMERRSSTKTDTGRTKRAARTEPSGDRTRDPLLKRQML